MPEVQTFLRDAWAQTERALAANDAERLRQEIAMQVDGLRHEIASQKDAITKGWKLPGLATAILAGLIFAAEGCAHFANKPYDIYQPSFSGFLSGLFGSLGGLLFGLAFWLSVPVVLVMVLWQTVRTSIAMARIAKCKIEIASREAP